MYIVHLHISLAGSNGSVFFESLAHGGHVFRVVAEESKEDKEVLRRKVTVPVGPDSCVIYLINAGVTTTAIGNATVEFMGTGPVEETTCRLDGYTFPCRFTLYHLY